MNMYVCMFQTHCAVWHICFKCYCIYIYDCMFQTCCAVWHICFKSYCFALRGSILRVQIGRKIAPRRGPGRSRELPGRVRKGARGVLERSLSQLEPDVPLGTLLGSFLESSWSRIGALVGHSWPLLGSSWRVLGPLWDHLGPF